LPHDEKIGTRVANSEKFKKVILGHKHFCDKNGNPVRKHFDAYLLKYFGLNSPVNMTRKMFVAMRNNLDGKGDDPKYYKPEMKAEAKQTVVKTFIESPLVVQWQKDYNQADGAESSEFLEQLENVLTGISNGYFGTSTPEGLKEIDEAFRAAMKEAPF